MEATTARSVLIYQGLLVGGDRGAGHGGRQSHRRARGGRAAPADLVKLTIYLTDPADVEPFMCAVGGSLPDPPPATTMLIVSGLASPALRVEIEAIAAR